jgi:hypothetical protein
MSAAREPIICGSCGQRALSVTKLDGEERGSCAFCGDWYIEGRVTTVRGGGGTYMPGPGSTPPEVTEALRAAAARRAAMTIDCADCRQSYNQEQLAGYVWPPQKCGACGSHNITTTPVPR